MFDSTCFTIYVWSWTCIYLFVKMLMAWANKSSKSYHYAEFFWRVFCKNLNPYKTNRWQIAFYWTNFIILYSGDNKSLQIPIMAFMIVPLLTSSWNYLSNPLLYRMHMLVKSRRDSSVWVWEIFFGKENSLSMYLTELLKSIVWFHYLNAF